MSTVPDHFDKELDIRVERVGQLIAELNAVIERHLAEDLCSAHAILGALEDVKQLFWHRMEQLRNEDDEAEDATAS